MKALRASFWLLVLTAAAVLALSPLEHAARAQDAAAPQAAFVPYTCTFIPARNSVQVRAVLMGSNGAPIPLDSFDLRVVEAATSTPVNEDLIDTRLELDRPPLRMLLVIDLTETVPLQEMVTALRDELIPALRVEDELALLTFSDIVSGVSQFYADKNRLINERLTDITLRSGDNQLFNAMRTAIDSTSATSTARQVIVVLTDSQRRGNQATPEEIVAAALETRTQFFPIAFNTQDRPDVGELNSIATGTGGFGWFYTSELPSRADVGRFISDSLGSLVNTLNSEITIEINLRGTSVEENSSITYDLFVDAENERDMPARITCPIERLTHTITFAGGTEDRVAQEPTDIEVLAESPLDPDLVSVAFWINDELVQDLPDTTFRFDTPEETPDLYVIRAQLRDRATDQVLATTPPLNFYAQQPLELTTANEETRALSGIVRFEAQSRDGFRLPPVQFLIAAADDPDVAYPLGTAEVGDDGRAVLTVDDITAEVRSLFPDVQQTVDLVVTALIPGTTPQVPPLAISAPLEISVALPLNLEDSPVPPVLTASGAVSCVLLWANLYVAGWVLFTRAKQIVHREDDYELSEHLMTVTVRRGGAQQSYDLTRKTWTIGRGSSFNDINLGDDPKVSRSHGAIVWRKGAWYYVNRKRNARTEINGRRYNGLMPYRLEPVTEIEIGDAMLVFHAATQHDISELTRTNL